MKYSVFFSILITTGHWRAVKQVLNSTKIFIYSKSQKNIDRRMNILEAGTVQFHVHLVWLKHAILWRCMPVKGMVLGSYECKSGSVHYYYISRRWYVIYCWSSCKHPVLFPSLTPPPLNKYAPNGKIAIWVSLASVKISGDFFLFHLKLTFHPAVMHHHPRSTI